MTRPTLTNVGILAAAMVSAAIVVFSLIQQAPQPGGPITDELQAAAADLNMPPVPDAKVGLLRQAQIIRELAKREKARNDR